MDRHHFFSIAAAPLAVAVLLTVVACDVKVEHPPLASDSPKDDFPTAAPREGDSRNGDSRTPDYRDEELKELLRTMRDSLRNLPQQADARREGSRGTGEEGMTAEKPGRGTDDVASASTKTRQTRPVENRNQNRDLPTASSNPGSRSNRTTNTTTSTASTSRSAMVAPEPVAEPPARLAARESELEPQPPRGLEPETPRSMASATLPDGTRPEPLDMEPVYPPKRPSFVDERISKYSNPLDKPAEPVGYPRRYWNGRYYYYYNYPPYHPYYTAPTSR